MIQKPEEFDSAFRYIVVVSQRAEQIINGAKPRGESRHVKPTLIARDDVDQGLVAWRILTQEELDAQRQAIVEQFRAEVGGEVGSEPARRIPDVLPTSVPFSGLDDDEAYEPDQDDELDRLQRLLGMAARAGRGGEARVAGGAEDAVNLGDEESEADEEEAAEDEVDAIEDIDVIEDEIPLDDEPEELDDEDDDE
jgi:DNA-directed RNA polymerase subunit K/omega